ncbi:MAG: hypothetical protein ACTSRP_19355 [Candidatus Helarchaeota archaeon]
MIDNKEKTSEKVKGEKSSEKVLLLTLYIPVEYLTYINEIISDINPYNWDLFIMIDIIGYFFISIGGLFLFHAFMFKYKIKFYKLTGYFVSILQVWFIPLGTFACYLIISELLKE